MGCSIYPGSLGQVAGGRGARVRNTNCFAQGWGNPKKGQNMITKRIVGVLALVLAAFIGCHGEVTDNSGEGDAGTGPPPACPNGTDNDQDGYGAGCAAGKDCDDNDPQVNEGATEICDGIDNDCDGQIDEDLTGCNTSSIGGSSTSPFPLDKTKDSNLQDATGVNGDGKGGLVLGTGQVDFRYLWIANTDDLTRGTISKVDAKALKEVGRFYTVTCDSNPGTTGCVDVNGKTIDPAEKNTPSRTAVDFNMDVWVANRCLNGGQPTATKIAADPLDCIDRNNNGKIDTSKDLDGDGKITVDCDNDGKPDSFGTTCAGSLAGKGPEFLGYDDECVLFTVAYGNTDDIARSVCLNSGKSIVGASDAWVGTYLRPENGRGKNRYYKINGVTGKIEATVDMPDDHHAYGCTADAHNVIWSTDIGHYETTVDGNLAYFSALGAHPVGKLLRGPTAASPWTGRNGSYRHYGISTDSSGYIWLGGIDTQWVLRYKPDRTSFDTLGKGTWTQIMMPKGFVTRGIAADLRGKVWVAIQKGYIFRLEQSIADGKHDMSNAQEGVDYWKLTAATKPSQELIGAGVDFDGNIWGVDKTNDTASRLDVDAKGDVKTPSTGTTNNVTVGKHPYTYSDFTGYGLANFVRPQGTWSYVHKPCGPNEKALWKRVSWTADTPPGTAVTLRVRTGDTLTTLGSWTNEISQSPAEIAPGKPHEVKPNPSVLLQVEFTLTAGSVDKSVSPTLKGYSVSYSCVQNVN